MEKVLPFLNLRGLALCFMVVVDIDVLWILMMVSVLFSGFKST